jgi:hypothetical protein
MESTAATIEFLRQEHARTLTGLQQELAALKTSNRGDTNVSVYGLYARLIEV